MSAKYQIFVSSTYQDLKEERDLIIKATMEMGHIPVGMEMFSAADEEQWNIIKKQIDQSDYYIVIVAHRYGSTGTNGISYTEKEYDYASSQGIPTLGFVIDESVSWPRDKSDTGTKIIAKLNAFKDKVKLKPVSFWKNRDDLYGKCSIALMKAFNAYPREGWIRASQLQDTAASKEIIRLSSENALLRERVAVFEKASSEEELISKVIEILRANERTLSVWKQTGADWEEGGTLTLYQIFETLAVELRVEAELHAISKFMATMFSGVSMPNQRQTWPTPRNQVRSILADLAAVDLIIPSRRKKLASDTNEYWCLSDLGVKLLAQMRLRRLTKVESLKKLSSEEAAESSEEAAESGEGSRGIRRKEAVVK